MSKFINKKRIQSLVMSVVIFTFMTTIIVGCSQPENISNDINEKSKERAPVYSTAGNAVTVSNNNFYLVPNNLNVESINITEDGIDLYYSLFSGLSDKAVESHVNQIVKNGIDEVKALLDPETIAPYRGIRTLIDPSSSIWNKQIYEGPQFNYNNILSIIITGSGNFNYSSMSWMSVVRTLNIDLNTGLQVPLKALFIDDFDYIDAINDAIVEELNKVSATEEESDYYFYQPIKLVKPFDSISEDQPYSLTEYNLTLYFDERDERFNNGFSPAIINISLSKFKDHLAVSERYMNEGQSLFIDDNEKRTLLYWNDQSELKSLKEEGSVENGSYYIYVSYSSEEMPAELLAKLDETRNWVQNERFENKGGWYEIHLSSHEVGPYLQLSSYIIKNETSHYRSSQSNEIYDHQGLKLALDDLFVDSSEVDTIIRDKIIEECNTNRPFEASAVEEKMDHAIYSISNYGLSVIIPVTEDDYFYTSLPYDVFGIHNWVMFNE